MELGNSLSKMEDNTSLSFERQTLNLGQLRNTLQDIFATNFLSSLLGWLAVRDINIFSSTQEVGELCDEGIECEIFNPETNSWLTGKLKLKVTLEFSADNNEL